ncbi:unnamed protein product [Larinioides sclopetarius]|uniref:BTB domain-containing protein n=1 Tax=Larinioides sclopetarius TaxID=280406 RepID=A0AAV2BR23_9ARAC
MESSKECGFTFTWIIENINYLDQNINLNSPNFNVNCLYKTEWNLRCVLRRDDYHKKIEKWLQLYKVETEPYNIDVSYELCLFDDNNEELQTFSSRKFFFHRGNYVAEYKCCKQFSRIKTIRCRMWLPSTKFCDIEQGFGRTRMCIERRRFIWTNTNIGQLKKTIFMTIYSKKCPSKCINLLLNISRICKKKLEIVVSNNFTCEKEVCCGYGLCGSYPYIQECQISIVDSKGNVMVCPEQEKWKIEEEIDPLFLGFEKAKIPKSKCHDKYYFLFSLDSANKDPMESCEQDNLASFQCECNICFGVELNQLEDVNGIPEECNDDIGKEQDGCVRVASSDMPPSNFMKDMLQLCLEKEFCDFNLKTETEIFPVHRAILGVRSPVFKAMFSHDIKENENKSVDVPDLSADTVRRMLLYIYTDKIENILWKDAFDLYIAGDKYQMLNLKERCSSILRSNLLPLNVCQILVLADERHDEDLKSAAQGYIVDHDAEIINLDAWKDIERNNPKLGVDILRQIVIKRQNV